MFGGFPVNLPESIGYCRSGRLKRSLLKRNTLTRQSIHPSGRSHNEGNMSIFDKCNIEYKHILLHEGSHYPQIGCFFAVAARGQGRSIPKVTIYVVNFLTDRSYPCPFCRYNYLDYCIALFSPRMFDRINTIFSVFTCKYSVDFHVIQNLQMLIRKLSSEDNIGRKRRKHSSIRTSQRRSAPAPQ